MGLLRNISRLGHSLLGRYRIDDAHATTGGLRICGIEELESRRLMAADLHVAAVYFEDATGDDTGGDVIEVTFKGGAPNTQLTRVVIEGDKDGRGPSAGDIFFDTQAGGQGAFGSSPLIILAQSGFTVLSTSVTDGGSRIVFDLEGFDAGEKLVFSIDADEIQFVDPIDGQFDVNALVEGGEFQRSQLYATFTANHFHPITGTALFWDAYDSRFATSEQQTGLHVDLPPDAYSPTHDFSDRTAGATTVLEQIPLPITVSGYVFEDHNVNNNQEQEDAGIAGVNLALLRWNGTEYASIGKTTVTNADGHYAFDDVLPGRYQVVETQPTGYFSVGSRPGTVEGQIRGKVLTSDVLTEIDLLGGEDSVHNDFAEALPNSISGNVHADLDGDCEYDPGEPLLAGVRIELLDASGRVIDFRLTDVQGNYKFDNLAPGEYGVREIQPAGYFDSGEHVGTAGGINSANDLITEIVLGSGVNGVHYDFCELLPASISGNVHADLDGDCIYDPGEPLLAGVRIELLDASGRVIGSTLTDAEGNYKFENLEPGEYGVREIQPAGYFDSGEHVGTAGGINSANDLITEIVLGSGVNAVHYDFCELLPASISGNVHADVDGDCEYDPGEPLLAGVRIELLDASGNVIGFTLTNAQGNYKFDNLAPGEYGVREIQPAGYFDSGDHVGSAGGVLGNDLITEIVLGSGVAAVHYDFCEMLPASISGNVHADIDGDCEYDPGEPLLAGVRIELLDASGNVIGFTLTDAQGNYKFDNLAPGEYGVREIQPVGYFDSGDHVGSAGGLLANDLITEIVLGSGVNAVHYDFCESPPVSISGYVYSDINNNGIFESGELGIPGVRVLLKGANGQPTGATTSTDSTGFYRFDGLAPGVYGVGEVQPAGYIDGLDTPGNAGGSAMNPGDMITGAVLSPSVHGVNYNFGELLPATLRGWVHVDTDGDCEYDPGEPRLANVVIRLLDAQGNVIATTLTNANGEYEFTGLAPGVYAVQEEQPVDYFDGGEDAGSAGGTVTNDLISEILLGPGQVAVDYHFCELPPATISGTVFQDGPPLFTDDGSIPDVSTVRDGNLTPDDQRLPGVVLELRHGVSGEAILGSLALPGRYAAGSPIRTTTDANGHFEFTGLPAGNYAVYEIQPSGYIDSIDTAGSTGGIAINPHANVGQEFLEPLAVAPNDDAIIRIIVFAGETSVNNNFSEVRAERPFFFIIPPPPNPLAAPAPLVLPPPPLDTIAPPQPPQFSPNPFYSGSSPVMNYTWHLSVIDAGQPRGSAARDAIVQLTTIRMDTVAWKKADLHNGQWTLLNRNKEAGRVRSLIFGVKDAIPVSGDFNGDGKTDIGVFKGGQWFIDLNGNGMWDEEDLWAKLGHDDDKPVTGDWDGDGKTDIGVYGPAWPGDPRAVAAEPGLPDPDNQHVGPKKNIPPAIHHAAIGMRSLMLTAQGKVRADLIDHVFHYGTPNDVPIVGDWNGDGIDTIGVFNKGTWYRDVDGDGKWSSKDETTAYGRKGDKPVVGDFNGDGIDEIGFYRDGVFYLDTNTNGQLDEDDEVISLGAAGAPVVGDWDGDGVDEVGVYQANVSDMRSASKP